MPATSNGFGTLIWAVMPNGWTTGRDGGDLLRLSIMLSPRLIGPADATLADYPLFTGGDGTSNWTGIAKTLGFQVLFDGADDAVTVAPDTSAIDDAVWRALFPATLSVTSHSFDEYTGPPISSNTCPVKENFNNIVDGYRQLPDELPDAATPSGAAFQRAAQARLSRLVAPTEEGRQTVRGHLQLLKATYGAVTARHIAAVPGITADVLRFDEMASFYEGLSKGARNRYDDAKQRNFQLDPHQFDFHTAFTGVSRYPDLMRALGLVFDLEIPFSGPLVDIRDGAGRVRLKDVSSSLATSPFEGWTLARPWTLYVLNRTAKTFFVRSANPSSNLVSGMLFLPSPDDYTAMGLNLDELAHGLRPSLVRFHKEAARARAAGTAPPTLTPPAPRSSGLSLSRSGLAGQLDSMLQKQLNNNNILSDDRTGAGVQLEAEDLLRGFRVDIRVEGQTTWRSLCQRAGTYKFTNGPIVRYWTDEGFIALRAFNPDSDTNDALWAHETLFRWLGWSLSVPRPGKTISPEDVPMSQSDQGTSNLPLTASFAPVAGSLPRLRFGWTYDCRLRIVDLAGNGLRLDSPISEYFTLPLGKYLRFDPLVAPTMLMKDPPKPGESVERLVIRSDFDTPSTETAERLIAPPKTSVQMAEWHGMLDTPTGLDPNVYSLLTQLDGTFGDAPYGDNPPPLPYLPDPLARGATFDFAPNPSIRPINPLMQVPLTQVPFDSAWPKLQTFRLILQEGAAEASWDPGARVLTVQIPKGWAIPINLASYMDDDVNNEGKQGLRLFDLWDSAKNNPDPAVRRRLERFRQSALQSKVPGLTPVRQLTLVHAVQRPLIKPPLDPTTTGFAVRRKEGDTFCTFLGQIRVDGPSTDKFELMAEWDEPIDDGVNHPSRRSSATLVRRRDIAATETQWEPDRDSGQETANFIPTRHEFGDTKYRRVTYRVRATTRFREYFPETLTRDIANISQVSDKVPVDVPASARPAAPKVLYVIPTFGWEQTGSGTEEPLSRKRRVGLRVYLDRPWYSSGDGELLGVLLAHKPFPPPNPDPGDGGGYRRRPSATGRLGGDAVVEPPQKVPETLAPFVTQWGTDPAFSSVSMSSAFTPLPAHFHNAKLVELDVKLAEGGPLIPVGFAVVGFDVQFDPPDPSNPELPADPSKHPHNGRWFCDIEIDTDGAYFPFLRLALVRFQPNGNPREFVGESPIDLRVSRVVLADFVQLAPGRSASATFDPNDATRLTVSVAGPSYQEKSDPGNVGRPAPRMVVSVQADFGDASLPLWIPMGDTELSRDTSQGIVNTLWSGAVVLPFARGMRPMRLVIREFERLPADDLDRGNISANRFVDRLVYADVLGIEPLSTAYNFTTIDAPDAASTILQGLNDKGQIVGAREDENGIFRSLLTDTRSFSTFDPPGPPGASQQISFASGINNKDEIVGRVQKNDIKSPEAEAYIKRGNSFSLYNHPNADPLKGTEFGGINDHGVRVGDYADNANIPHGIIQDDNATTLLESSPNIPANKGNWLFDINNLGQMVGGYFDALRDIQHGLFTDGTAFITIDFPGSDTTWLNGINDLGQMVGAYFDDATQVFRGFIADRNGFTTFTTIDYPDLPQGFGTFPTGIDNSGRIVGYYGAEVGLEGVVGSRAAVHGFLATPFSKAARKRE
jgi:hypothetical protein